MLVGWTLRWILTPVLMKLNSSPLLPAEHIPSPFRHLLCDVMPGNVDNRLRRLVTLMKREWAAGCGQSAVGRHFNPSGPTMMSRAGTTGSISRPPRGSSTSISLLHCCSASSKADIVSLQCILVSERRLRRHQRKRYARVQECLEWTRTGLHTAPVRWRRQLYWRSVHMSMDWRVESEQCQCVTSRPRTLLKFHEAKVLGTFALEKRKFHGCKSSKERKFLDFSLLVSECSTER